MRHDAPAGLGAGRGTGGRVSTAGRCAAQGKKKAASPLTFRRLPRSRLGDAPREGTGPPLSVKAGCDRGTTANRQAARHMDTRSPALSAEPPAAPEGSESGQAQPAPTRGAARPVTTGPGHQRTPENESELAFDSHKERKNYTNPLTVSVHASRGLPGTADHPVRRVRLAGLAAFVLLPGQESSRLLTCCRRVRSG